MSRKPKNHSGLTAVLITLIVIMIAATGLIIFLCVDMVNSAPQSAVPSGPAALPTAASTAPEGTTAPETLPPETTLPEPEHVVSTATVLSTGDLLMHKPIISKNTKGDGTYDFSPIFKYCTEEISQADYAIANLETTLAGTAKPYQGNPFFNCPDEIVTACKDAGFDMLLTANNHAFDTGFDGYVRTLDVTREAGLETLGTMKDETEPKYTIQEVNGIRIGMICYTYETTDGSTNQPALNGNPMYGATYENINCYRPSNPQSMYGEVERYLAEMKETGVDATMLFIHWGPNEYELYANQKHQAIAQKLCDLGIDVIVGGHPHVVQPMDLLTSAVDPEHKTIVLYSMGNAVSNQRLGNISSVSTAHTEDGVLFSVTFCKYSDGTVYVESTDLIPTWVNLTDNYYILPLDDSRESEWQSLFDLNDTTLSKAQNSYSRTMDLVGEGLTKCQEWLSQCQAERDEYYYGLAGRTPEAAVETVPETIPETTVETLADAA